jgi:2,4-dienoyl-CoA reductase-like NADH-dependent reductase (Old Yellow Enzyme family)
VIKSQGSEAGIQIGHAGRKASISPPFKGDYLVSEADGGWPDKLVAPSVLPSASHYGVPHDLTKEEIKEIVKNFADAAIRADRAAVDFLELHGAHA